MYALEATGLRVRLADREVLAGVDIAVSPGEVVTLVGPSGCGKSTLLRAIAGLRNVDEGSVLLAGVDVTNLPAEERRVGLVFQDNALFGHLRVGGNVAFGLRHLPKKERRERVAEVLDLVKLGHLARRYPHQLSGGEQQRVAVARALAPKPSVVLLDEPFGALDEVLREELGWEVREILAKQETAALLVTHDRHEAITLGDRVAVMGQGKILQCAPPQEVYERPINRFVADFLAVASYVKDEAGEEKLVRPHQLRVSAGGPHQVFRVEYLGATSRYTIKAADGSLLISDVGPTEPLTVGDACSVEVLHGEKRG